MISYNRFTIRYIKGKFMRRDDPRLRPIPGFPDYYVEEKLGNIWSFKQRRGGRILKPCPNSYNPSSGEPSSVAVTLCKNGKRYTISVARLVMNVTDSNITVDHKDRNIWNNKKENLRKATRPQQSCNRASYSVTGFKYVCINGNGFQVIANWNGKSKGYGTYSNVFEAAAVANMVISEFHDPDFAVFNEVSNRTLTLEDNNVII